MSVFDTGLDTLFNDGNLGIDILYEPSGGAPVTVRAIRQRPDLDSQIAPSTKLQQMAVLFDVRTSELPCAAEGDTITDDVASYRVMNGNIKDPRRGILTIEAAPL